MHYLVSGPGIQEAQLNVRVADRTAPSHTSTITRYVFERSTRSVDKRLSYLRELVWQPSWQLDTCRDDRLNCASVYTVNCELCTASAHGQYPRQATPVTHALWSRGPLHSSQILNNISDVVYVMQTNNPESGFNSDHTIRQYAHGLLLESQFLPSSTDCLAVRAKMRQKRPSRWP